MDVCSRFVVFAILFSIAVYAFAQDPALIDDQPITAVDEQAGYDAGVIPSGSAILSQEQIESIVQNYLDRQKVDAPTTAPSPPPAPKKAFPDMKMTGFFQLDAARFSQDAASRATLGDVQDGLGFRRARLAATGNIAERTSYMFEFDLAQGQARFVDVWGQYSDTPLGNVRIGRFRQPFGMTELTSVRDLPFLERPSLFALAPFRQTGVMFFDTALNDRMTWAFSGFRTISDNFGNVYGDNGGYGTAERITFLPMDCGDEGLVHIGLDHSYLDPARNLLQYASQDEVFVGQNPNFGPGGFSVSPLTSVPPFLQTGVFPVDHINLFNVEAAASMGRAVVQSEMRWSNLNLPSGNNVTIPGAYLDLRYMLTGEVIPYNRTNGVFTRPTPRRPVNLRCGDLGAWELNAQVSYLDFNPLFGLPGLDVSTTPPTATTIGPARRMTNTTLGTIWYLNSHSKIHTQYIHTDLDDITIGPSVTHTVASMIQFDF